MISKSRFSVTVVLALCLSASAAGADSDLGELRKKLEQRLSDVKISGLQPSLVPGLAEMTYGTRVAYMSADGRYMLVGDLIDLELRRNLTSERRTGLVKRAIDAVGESNMIVIGPKNPKRTITVFTDVDCPYCSRLHQEVPKLTAAGIKVRYLLYPRAGKGSDTYKRSVAVWCSKDRVKAVGIAKSGGKIPLSDCPNPVDANILLGQDVGVDGTPTIVVDDGRIIPGFVPAAQLIAGLGLQDAKQDAKKDDANH